MVAITFITSANFSISELINATEQQNSAGSVKAQPCAVFVDRILIRQAVFNQHSDVGLKPYIFDVN